MIKIINKDYPLRREEVTREEARTRIEALNEPYKLEILDAIKTEPITCLLYTSPSPRDQRGSRMPSSA